MGVVLEQSVGDIWELGEGVVSPDDEVLDTSDINLQFFRDLVSSSVLVQSGQSSEVSGWNIWSEMRADHRVGVGWVSNNNNLDVSVGPLVNGLSLRFENQSILSEKVLSFHSWSSWLGTDQDSQLASLESLLVAGGSLNLGQ